jgi:hypothetical protein
MDAWRAQYGPTFKYPGLFGVRFASLLHWQIQILNGIEQPAHVRLARPAAHSQERRYISAAHVDEEDDQERRLRTGYSPYRARKSSR